MTADARRERYDCADADLDADASPLARRASRLLRRPRGPARGLVVPHAAGEAAAWWNQLGVLRTAMRSCTGACATSGRRRGANHRIFERTLEITASLVDALAPTISSGAWPKG